MSKVAIQGFEGSFHEEAAELYFGKGIETIFCKSFKQVVKNAQTKTICQAGVMAIENSIAGSILPNYTLIDKAKLKITGEIYLPIKQQLLVNKGVKIADIKEVHSHPMALLQCADFLDTTKWKLVETEDTALSAKHLQSFHSKHVAAIASKLAAQKFNLEILVPNIHTEKYNFTRFLVVQHASLALAIADANKATIKFNTNHSKGSLAKVLTVIAQCGINLSKLQSMPIAGSKFLYTFYADVEFDTLATFEKGFEKIVSVTEEAKIFGVYKNGNNL
jgi:prephenate dehydratase